jgi:predicted Zn-dependent protease
MKLRIAAAFVLCATALWGADAVYDAMQSELTRSMTLSLKTLDKPYFVSYMIDDGMAWTASAFQGGLVNTRASRFRTPAVQVRVGDYEFDNTNGGPGRGRGASYNLSGFPLDDDPLVIRQYLWLETDSAYKGAVQAIAQKRASRRSVNVTDQLPDFAKAKPFTLNEDRPLITFDNKAWNERIRRVSAIFGEFSNLRDSAVTYSVIDGVHRYVNNEGTRVRQMQTEVRVQLAANIQAADGMVLRDTESFYQHDVNRMPSEEELSKTVRTIANQLTKLAAAPMGEDYSGPILFEGTASAQLMADLLGRNLHVARPPAGGGFGRGGRGGPGRGGATELQGRRGVRIMPDMFTVVDDPTLPGFGHNEVDNEGVPSLPVALVEKGVLKDFLRTRLPVQGFDESNGRAMMGNSPAPTNLVISTAEKSSLAEMKQKMIDLCKQRSLKYGVVIRKLDFPTGGAFGAAGVAPPLYVYRLYIDGHEEMIRGVRLRSVDARSLKDILLAGDDMTTLDYVEGGSADVSVRAPSVLIDDLELEKVNDTLPKLPTAPSPLVAGAAR